MPPARAPLGVSVAVVNFNTKDLLERCLESVLAANPDSVVVVDNHSSDGSAAVVRERFPTVCLIANDVNRGYGGAANQAVRVCSSPFVLLLNSDTRGAPDTLANLATYLKREGSAAVVGPRLVSGDGRLQRSTYPFPHAADIIFGESGLHQVIRRVPWLRERFLRTWAHDRPRAVPWVLGAAITLRRTAFDELGGFDEAYFLYYEEIDLCRRAADLGLKTHFAPVATVIHDGGASTGQDPPGAKRHLLTSMRRYLRVHEPRSRGQRVLSAMRIIDAARFARDVARLIATRAPDERAQRRAALRDAGQLLRDRASWQV